MAPGRPGCRLPSPIGIISLGHGLKRCFSPTLPTGPGGLGRAPASPPPNHAYRLYTTIKQGTQESPPAHHCVAGTTPGTVGTETVVFPLHIIPPASETKPCTAHACGRWPPPPLPPPQAATPALPPHLDKASACLDHKTANMYISTLHVRVLRGTDLRCELTQLLSPHRAAPRFPAGPLTSKHWSAPCRSPLRPPHTSLANNSILVHPSAPLPLQ